MYVVYVHEYMEEHTHIRVPVEATGWGGDVFLDDSHLFLSEGLCWTQSLLFGLGWPASQLLGSACFASYYRYKKSHQLFTWVFPI